MAGLSQEALAKKAGDITKQAISKYERGKDTPSSGVLLRLARALEVRPDWLLRPETVDIGQIAFRRRRSMRQRELDRIAYRVRDEVERYLMLERIVLGPHANECHIPKSVEKARSVDQAEEAAEKLRAVWGLGVYPIANLTAILEEQGVRVIGIDGSKDFDGLSAWADGKIPIIVVGADWPGDRQRFTLAHELGHLLIERADESREDEKWAQRFAGAFLIPRQAAYDVLGEHRRNLTFEELYSLKHAFGVSMACWVYRATDLGIISQWYARSLWREFGKRKWRRKEPGKQVASEKPTRLQRLLHRALADGVISESRAAELAGISLREFHQQWQARSCVPA